MSASMTVVITAEFLGIIMVSRYMLQSHTSHHRHHFHNLKVHTTNLHCLRQKLSEAILKEKNFLNLNAIQATSAHPA